MSGVLERVRMCVAEAGYDPERVTEDERGPAITYQRTSDRGNDIPIEVVWRAFSIGSTCTACLACFTVMSGNAECLADRRLVLDCGRPR